MAVKVYSQNPKAIQARVRRARHQETRLRNATASRKWKEAHPNWRKGKDRQNESLLRRYGISSEEYNMLLLLQRGVCAVCGKPPKKLRLSVDHDHNTNLIRGLLCYRCNRRIIANHSAGLLLKAVEYLTNPPARVFPFGKPRL